MISGANDWTAYQQRDWLEDLRELLREVEDRLAPSSRGRVLDMRLSAGRQIEDLAVTRQ